MAVPVWTAGLEKNAPAHDFGVIKVRIVSNAIKEFVKIVKKLKKKRICHQNTSPVRQGQLQAEIELKNQSNPRKETDGEQRPTGGLRPDHRRILRG
jgi:hypothetical protein